MEIRITENRSGYLQLAWNAKRANGSWGTVTRSCGTKDRKIAEEMKAALLADMKELDAREKQAAQGTSFDELADAYFEHYVARNDIKIAQRSTLGIVRRFFGPYQPEEMTPELFDRYRASRRNGHTGAEVAPATLRRDLSVVSAVLHWAKRTRRLSAERQLPLFELPRNLPIREVFLDEAEQDQLLDLARVSGDEQLTLFIEIALETAARRASIEMLEWSQVDFTPGHETIDFRNLQVRQTAKRRIRQPMSDRLIPVMKAAWMAQGRPKSGHVLGDGYTVRWAWEALRAASPRPELRVHDLRRSAAIRWARAGVPMWEIAGLLGDSVATTTKHYLHHAPDHLRRAVNRRRAA